jgi:hypothetical protein
VLISARSENLGRFTCFVFPTFPACPLTAQETVSNLGGLPAIGLQLSASVGWASVQLSGLVVPISESRTISAFMPLSVETVPGVS